MHTQDLGPWTHHHVFDEGDPLAERGTRLVMWITAAMMVVEIVAGWWFNSMALLADGWHMSSHALAIGLSAFAYAAARRYASDTRFAFGTWKIEVLAGFASAISLLGVAALMVVGSIERLVRPGPIEYGEAIVIAIAGLAVNVVCALILGKAHHHGHEHDAEHHHNDPPRHDFNLKSAYRARDRRCGNLRSRYHCTRWRDVLWVVVARPDDGPGRCRTGWRLGLRFPEGDEQGPARPRNGRPPHWRDSPRRRGTFFPGRNARCGPSRLARRQELICLCAHRRHARSVVDPRTS